MSDIYVKTEHLSKRFRVLKKNETLLRTLKAFVKHESLKRELWVLRGISFEITKGEKLALIGKNGSGKTTLLRILSGIYNQTSGSLAMKSEPNVIFRLSIGLNILLQVIDNIYLLGAFHGIPKDVLRHKVHEILELAELQHLMFSPLRKLSLGQQQRLAISVFFQASGDFFIFDESTAFVDLGFTHKCEEYFRRLFSPETTVIMASHDMSLLRKYCNTALWLDEGRIRMRGSLEEVITAYESYFEK